MNIFYLDEDPVMAAQYHSDTHIIKMTVEVTQILMSNFHFLNGFTRKKDFTDDYINSVFSDFPRRDEKGNPKPYGVTHFNHPSTIWAREYIENYHWLLSLGLALCSEYKKRYNKEHACFKILQWIIRQDSIYKHEKFENKEAKCMTSMRLAMPDFFRSVSNVNLLLEDLPKAITNNKEVNAYRAYYIYAKNKINKWRHSEKPFWLSEI